MGFDNQAYGQRNSIPGNDPEYMEIGQLQQPSVGFLDPGEHYQALNNANNVYEGLDFSGRMGSQSEA